MELVPRGRPNKKEVVPFKGTNVKATDRLIATQDNYLIYARHDLTLNETKFLYLCICKIDSRDDKSFNSSIMHTSEISEAIGQSITNFSYIKKLSEKISDKRLKIKVRNKNMATNKSVLLFKSTMFFDFIIYEEGKGNIIYKLHDDLYEYLLNLKKNFTKIQYEYIKYMKSVYGIRIYSMLICEISQNRTKLSINLKELQDILNVPRSLIRWDNFNKDVLDRAKKDINRYSNIDLENIKTYKTGRKFTDIEFIFDYKDEEMRINRDASKMQYIADTITKKLDDFMGKDICISERKRLCEADRDDMYTIRGRKWNKTEQAMEVSCEKLYGQSEPFTFYVRNIYDIEKIKLQKERAESVYRIYKSEEEEKLSLQIKTNQTKTRLEALAKEAKRKRRRNNGD